LVAVPLQPTSKEVPFRLSEVRLFRSPGGTSVVTGGVTSAHWPALPGRGFGSPVAQFTPPTSPSPDVC
jgi:hypothetical protein